MRLLKQWFIQRKSCGACELMALWLTKMDFEWSHMVLPSLDFVVQCSFISVGIGLKMFILHHTWKQESSSYSLPSHYVYLSIVRNTMRRRFFKFILLYLKIDLWQWWWARPGWQLSPILFTLPSNEGENLKGRSVNSWWVKIRQLVKKSCMHKQRDLFSASHCQEDVYPVPGNQCLSMHNGYLGRQVT